VLSRVSKRLARALLATSALLATLGLCELALRSVSPATNAYFLWPPFLELRTEPPAEVFPGVSGPSVFRVNSLGLRADEPGAGDAPVVLAVGGSTTECLVLDQSEAWPRLVQDALSAGGTQAWVGNAGRSGHGTREHVYQVPILLDALPRTDALLVLAGVNDLGLRLAQDADYDPDFLQAPGVDAQQVPRAFSLYPVDYAGDLPFYKRTELWARGRALKHRLASRLGVGTSQGGRGEGITRWRGNRAHATELRDALPSLGPALAEYERNLTRIVQAAGARGVTVVLLTQPSLWRADLEPEAQATLWWGGVGDFQRPGARVPYYTAQALAEGCSLYNEATLRVAQRTGALAFDLASVVPRTREMFYDDMHFTEAGARLVAEAVAVFLRAHGLRGT
jgi:lysophospholipase L1-like esterase